MVNRIAWREALFQSTLPAREATIVVDGPVGQLEFQSTLPAREATDLDSPTLAERGISIHASREGSDLSHEMTLASMAEFQSTLPAREATNAICTCSMVPWRFQSTLPAREAT